MANRSGAPPGLESRTPDPAGTGPGAKDANLAGGQSEYSSGEAPSQSPTPVEQRYGPTLEAMRPGCGAIERRQRCGILYLRDRAAAALRVAGWEASHLLSAIVSLGTVHAFATMPAAELEELHHQLVRVMSAAMALDQRGPRAEGIQ